VKAAIAAALVALTASAARADQCQWHEDPAVVTRAARELTSHPEVVAFCEPCGDVAPGAPHRVTSVTTRRPTAQLVSLEVDGEEVDLAYLYVKTSAGQYRNLAALAGCPTTGVSPRLRVDAATSAGVLIRAEQGAPPAALPEPAALPQPAATPAPVAPTVVIVASPSPSLWLIALVGVVAPITGLGSLALWLLARRRERHVPRASRLTPPG